MITKGLEAFSGRRVLLLQSAMGPFFWRLAKDLRWAGAQVCKVNFNGGDAVFYPSDAIRFSGHIDDWPAFLNELVTERDIDLILMFGDCRPMHRVARQVANHRGLEVGVFEEGYLRPHYVTFERFGVNGNSQLPRQPLFYLNRDCTEQAPVQSLDDTFWATAWWAVLYYLAAAALRPWFPHYRHHRSLSLTEALPWARSFIRKAAYAFRERRIAKALYGPLAGKFFLVPLQVHNDAQIHAHSGFDSVERFIRYVVKSFAANGPADARLVIKHHPMDRGYHDYRGLLRELAVSHGLRGRLHYVHDLHLPTLLQNARGVVVVNSTVGLSALFHSAPVKVCGSAIYDMAGLTFRGSLKEFWTAAPAFEVDRELFRRFRAYLVDNTQLNGSFYKRLDRPGSYTGLVWPKRGAEASVQQRPRHRSERSA